MDPVTKLRKLGYSVVAFSEYHFRVEDVFDFWVGKSGCKWHDRVTDERGHKPPDQIVQWIAVRLGKPGEKATKEKAWTDKQLNRT
jgi:hypothetical protein